MKNKLWVFIKLLLLILVVLVSIVTGYILYQCLIALILTYGGSLINLNFTSSQIIFIGAIVMISYVALAIIGGKDK